MRFFRNLLLHNHPSKGIPNGVRFVKYLVCGSREIWGGTLHLHKISTVGVKLSNGLSPTILIFSVVSAMFYKRSQVHGNKKTMNVGILQRRRRQCFENYYPTLFADAIDT